MARAERPPEILSVIEDDPDIQFLIRTIFALDSRFTVSNMSETTEDALERARTSVPGIIVLDHGEAGSLTGLDAAPLFKKLAPHAKIILFTAHAGLEARAEDEPAIDAFLLKTDPAQLLPLAVRLAGLEELFT